MSNLSDVKRSTIGACLAGASVSRTANLVGVSRPTVSRVKVDYTNLVKHGGGSVMVWDAISSRRLGLLVVLGELITGDHCRSILADHLQPKIQILFPGERAVFQDDNAAIYTHLVILMSTLT
ncbi:hypothetical protein TNCV_5046291 [Trichonephila clavipes]|uniref:Uncharacterized protein n=1 Tax=Trichonephila clavipes TaxID=2585209 RepID=A0A8X6WI28_TRICX|nr:hypothetical protein TNCV_5046291 [Trichonephila clavipes]